MKITITEFRDMVAQAVRRTVQEARKPKEVPPRSEESVLAQRDRHVRGLPGYAHGNVLDMSKPLGRRSLAKRQGAANMGGWTSEARDRGPTGEDDAEASFTPHDPGDQTPGSDGSRLMDILTRNGVPFDRAQRIVAEFSRESGDDEGGGEDVRTEAVRRLVRMVVREEIRARG